MKLLSVAQTHGEACHPSMDSHSWQHLSRHLMHRGVEKFSNSTLFRCHQKIHQVLGKATRVPLQWWVSHNALQLQYEVHCAGHLNFTLVAQCFQCMANTKFQLLLFSSFRSCQSWGVTLYDKWTVMQVNMVITTRETFQLHSEVMLFISETLTAVSEKAVPECWECHLTSVPSTASSDWP